MALKRADVDGDPLWYKDAVFYEVRVRSFADSDGDGIGDFRGLTEKLDYLQDLGVTALWLLPFYPSPLRDDGYDISDYMSVHPDCGTLADFRHFLKEAHRRGLKVVTELVMNHTSDQHPWFQRARRASGAQRDFYVWNQSADKYNEARIIFKDFEHSNWTWDPVAKSHYWHRFFAHQPDLNFDNPAVRKAMLKVLDFWLGMGVDGFRLDAVPYLFERDGTNCENLPETHAYLRQLRAYVDKRYANRMLLAEANQWPDDAVAYFGKGDECHMAFHFPIMPRMFMAIHMEDRLPLVDILSQTPSIPDASQWALFLRNHDELTLEMVTDEERDYMYKVYANDPVARINLGIRRRLAPLLGNHRRKIELMNGLLFSLPGTPVIYYGDEIGMGDNIYLGDRHGVRTPMQWSSDKNAGFSRANPQRLLLPIIIDPEYHYEAINVEAQQDNPHSLLRWMKRLIGLRKKYRAFGRGTIEFLAPRNNKVLVFIRRYEDETILVVANLSRFVQYVELPLANFKGRRPVELFGRVEFPPIGDLPYFVTLGPHSFYWFSIEPVTSSPPTEIHGLPELEGSGDWDEFVAGDNRAALEAVLAGYLPERRWFSGKSRTIRAVRIDDAVPFPYASRRAFFASITVDFTDGRPENYLIPIAFQTGERANAIKAEQPGAAIASMRGRSRGRDVSGLIFDAVADPDFCAALLEAIGRGRIAKSGGSVVEAFATPAFRRIKAIGGPMDPKLLSAEQSNSSIRFGDLFILKLYRKWDVGLNPDFEIGRFLTERTGFRNIAPVAGALEYHKGRGEKATIGMAVQFVPNRGDAWEFTQGELRSFFEAIPKGPPPAPSGAPLVERAKLPVPESIEKAAGRYLKLARLLGRRTGELHLALASDSDDPAFRPEPFTPFSQRSLYQSLRGLQQKVFQTLSRSAAGLPKEAQADAERVLAAEGAIAAVFQSIRHQKVRAAQIRCHGDYHLGQVLFTGEDFIIIDFEGEPARSVSERRLKRSPLKDVAGMIRSYHYAAHAALRQANGGADSAAREAWGERWFEWISAQFLGGYLEATAGAPFLPDDAAAFQALLDLFVLEKAVYELGYELNNRPDWVRIPMAGILGLVPENPKR